MSLPHQLVKSLVLDYLKGHPGGQVGELKADIKENPSAAPIFRAFLALQQRLEFMANQKKLPGDLAESIHGDLRGTFDLVRRARNEAGHPAISVAIDADAVFLNLRIFSAYANRIYRFIDYFKANVVDW